MSIQEFYFIIGVLIGGLMTDKIKDYLRENGFSDEDLTEFKKSLDKLSDIAYRDR